jgi:gluconokinase
MLPAMILVLMGVSGSGKTTIGALLAKALQWRFYEGDELHSAANRSKMTHGIALTDADRLPWLHRIRRLIERCLAEGVDAVIACSALKRSYREVIVSDPKQVRIVYLKGSPKLVKARLGKRKGHFMPSSLLPSQFAALEEPHDAITIDVSVAPAQIVDAIRKSLAI